MNFGQNNPLLAIQAKINNLQLKIQEIIKRLDILQNKSTSQQEKSQDSNKFFKYIAPDIMSPLAIRPAKRKQQEDYRWKSQQRWFSQRERSDQIQEINKLSQNRSMDSKSFNIIKESILLNSQQVFLLKQKLFSIQKYYHDKMIILQQGFEMITRLTIIIQQNYQKLAKTDNNNPNQHPFKSNQHQKQKLINKYTKYQRHKKRY